MARLLLHLLLAASLASLPATGPGGRARAQIALPDIGDPSRSSLSSAEEQRMSEAFLREIRTHLRLVEDPEMLGYVESLGNRIAAASESPGAFRFLLVDSPTINAFAGPGGIIAVNTGLILLSQSESELAAVVAHEIAHVTQRHLARAVQDANRVGPLALAGVLAALVLSTQDPEAGRAAMATALATAAQRRLDFTRQNEEEADRVGIAMLARAGFDPRAVPTFFERLQQSHRYSTEPPEFLSTHPVTVNRIADSRARAEQFPYRQYVDSEPYHLVRAKIRAALGKDVEQAVATFRAELERGQFRSEAATRYGLAIALARVERWPEAKEQVAWLLEHDPNRASYRALAAEVAQETGATERALEIYRETLAIFPDDTLVSGNYAQTLLELGRPAEALAVLERHAKTKAPTVEMLRLEAQAYQRLGRTLEAHSTLAEAHYRIGDLRGAMRQLQIGLEEPGSDQYARARAEAKLELVKNELELRSQR